MPKSNDELDDTIGVHTVDHAADQQQTLKNDKQIDDFEQWSKDLQSASIDTDYDKLTDEIAKIIDKLKITIADYVTDSYFGPICLI